ncbi:CPBP family intramembrane glutamic endopeptidase [Fictibacillus sp. BK138]|uniref:CPBP family intramembrane glutamic endopeptidase n=1 Tax=Fictibacillus sp. BK138 TaxID=2512121 RepID=UPI0010292152|nr:CPBP family intramembrane glutamic endopeptidase [Fictibacillus sp. BK138]RZT23508.1 CAAX prenyl protease-like protein [Fictibacillus sp. BK138]
MKKISIGISLFLLLNLYFNVTTHFISNTIIQLMCILLFFPIAHYSVKLVGLPGLKGLGLVRSKKGSQYFLISFLIGFSCWTAMYAVYWYLGKFEITGVKTGLDALWIGSQVIAGFLLGSLINDLITRGYIINWLSEKLKPLAVGCISVLIYAIDDFWNGEPTIVNFVFSLILGVSFTYAFLKTGSLWANTGIHFGLNVSYGMIYGLSGNYGAGLITTSKGDIHPLTNHLVVLSAAVVIFIIVYYVYRNPRSQTMIDVCSVPLEKSKKGGWQG